MYDYLDIHTHHRTKKEGTTSIYNVRGDEQPPAQGLYSCGVHPYDALTANQEWLLNVDFGDPRLVAIGEVGLDFRFAQSIPQQMQWFKRQISVAKEYKLPMIIHSVKSLPQCLKLLREEKIEQFIIHGFRGSLDNAKEIIQSHGTIALGEPLLKDQRLQQVARQIPLENIFLESDENPVEITDLYNALAQIKEKELQEIKQEIENNFKRIFTDAKQ